MCGWESWLFLKDSPWFPGASGLTSHLASGQRPDRGWVPRYSPGIMRPSGWPKPAGSPGSERGREDLSVTLLSDSREETRSWLAASAAGSNLGSMREVCCELGLNTLWRGSCQSPGRGGGPEAVQEGFFFCLSHPVYHFRSRAADGRTGAMRNVRCAGRRHVHFQ